MHARHITKDLMGIHIWRQAETQTVINNFYEEDMNIFNPRINARGNGEGLHRMEFPLMQWLVAGTYKIFGKHILVTRIFMFLIGIFSVAGMYFMIKNILGNNIPAMIGAWAFNFSPSFYYYTINPMPDNLALCFGIWGIAMFFAWARDKSTRSIVFSGLFLGLSALCKLPFILYFSVPLMYFLLEIRTSFKSKSTTTLPLLISAVSILMFAFPALIWYISVIPQWKGNGIVTGVIDNKIPFSEIFSNITHHLFITLIELLLNYGSVLFFILAFYWIIRKKSFKNQFFPVFATWGIVLILYFLFESNMIGKSHDYYLFPFLPLLFLLVGFGAGKISSLNKKAYKALTIILLLLLPFFAFLRMDKRWDPDKPGFNKDLLLYKDDLRDAVPENALCVAGNDFSNYIFYYYIDKKGWGYYNDYLDGEQLKQMIVQGAQYLYSDSRKIDENRFISVFLERLVLEKGSIRVYKLKQGFQP